MGCGQVSGAALRYDQCVTRLDTTGALEIGDVMRCHSLRLGLLGLLALGATACTVTVTDGRRPPDIGIGAPRAAHVPAGHYPPPGECRVWYPDRPPGHQPPPGPCNHQYADRGSFVLYNGRAWDADYNWRAHAHRHPGAVPRIIIKLTTH